MPGRAKKIAVVAYSAGGSVTASLVSSYFEDFKARVFAIAFLDAFGSPFGSGQKYFGKVRRIITLYVFLKDSVSYGNVSTLVLI